MKKIRIFLILPFYFPLLNGCEHFAKALRDFIVEDSESGSFNYFQYIKRIDSNLDKPSLLTVWKSKDDSLLLQLCSNKNDHENVNSFDKFLVSFLTRLNFNRASFYSAETNGAFNMQETLKHLSKNGISWTLDFIDSYSTKSRNILLYRQTEALILHSDLRLYMDLLKSVSKRIVYGIQAEKILF